jgi:methionyl-tRNA synthetase
MEDTTKKEKILITTAIDYANAVIHVGHAYEKLWADCVARYEKIKRGSDNVYFLTGTDVHGTTNEKAAKKRGIPVEEHVKEISDLDQEQINALGINYSRFIRTTDKDHVKTATEFFQKSYENGDLYKDTYTGLYCEGCEAYKTLSELNSEGQCQFHPTREIQKLKEENWFFKWTKYSDFLKNLVSSEHFVANEGKKREMLAFIEQGLIDIPVTRPKYKVAWGITPRNDSEQVIYVWFDALINYYTAGIQNGFWDDDTEIVHFVGKDIARWHCLLWPAMLKSAGIRLPDKIYIHGFINLNGQKISKSLGNVISPTELVDKYGEDAVRYYLLKHGPITEDTNITIKHLEEVYNGELANGLGNTVARIAKLAEKSGEEFRIGKIELQIEKEETLEPMNEYRVDVALQNIWKRLAELDKQINVDEPWKLLKNKEKIKPILQKEIEEIREIANLLEPFMPKAAHKIHKIFAGPKIKAQKALFPRIN